jgi:hypothetical protein
MPPLIVVLCVIRGNILIVSTDVSPPEITDIMRTKYELLFILSYFFASANRSLRYIPETFCPDQGLLLSGKEGILREQTDTKTTLPRRSNYS